MKTLTLGLLLLMLVLGFRGAGAAPPAPTPGAPLVGTVLEVKEVAPYSYLRLRTKEGEVWAAVPTAPVKVGADVTIASPQTMSGFHSKSLNRTFDRIVFGTLGSRDGQAAQTVAGIVTGAASLKDKPVTVRGQVVKFTADVMGKNWLHLRDGTGSATDGSNDVLIVTGDKANVGDVVQIKGTVRTDRNLGSGYSYKVLVEDATLTK
jgi:hypothetical protein